MLKVLMSLALLMTAGFLVCGPSHGQNPNTPPVYTVISVEKMHCNGCAQRLAGKLYEVPGVEKIQVDVEKKVVWVHPKAGMQPSPRNLWEAVEKGNDRPTKLHGPYGVFTAKPQS